MTRDELHAAVKQQRLDRTIARLQTDIDRINDKIQKAQESFPDSAELAAVAETAKGIKLEG